MLPNPRGRNILFYETGSIRNILLIALLLIVTVAGYLYFFTDLIKVQEGINRPPVQETQVKKPIPPRVEQGAATAQTKPAATVSAPQTATPATPATSPVTQPSVTAKSSPPSTSQQIAKTEKPQAPVASSQAKVTAAVVANPAAPTPIAKTESTVKQTQAEGKVTPKTSTYTLLIGEFVLNKSIMHEKALLKKLGIAPVLQKKVKRSEPMTRLMVGEYSDRNAAALQIAKLKSLQSDGFIIQEGGKYCVYAGSYFLEGRAAVAQDKLYDKGLKTVMKKTKVSVPVVRMTAGQFTTQDEAVKAQTLLKKKGVKAQIIASTK